MMYEQARTLWSTEDHDEAERFDAWQQTLNATYLDWDINKPDPAQQQPKGFNASVSTHSFNEFTFVDCRCEPFQASRRATHIRRDDREVLGIQLVLSGREAMDIGGQEVQLAAGDILIWNNTRPISFSVQESLHKLSVIMPLARLRHWLPTSWCTIDNKIANSNPSGQLLASFMRGMQGQMAMRQAGNGDALIEATLGILVDAVNTIQNGGEDQSLKAAQMLRIRQIIANNLTDPDLNPLKIATLARISLRYLHWLFADEQTTVSEFVIQQRLQRCGRELANPLMQSRTITDIAFSGGFQSSGHFSRRFKQCFGASPSDYRHQALSPMASLAG